MSARWGLPAGGPSEKPPLRRFSGGGPVSLKPPRSFAAISRGGKLKTMCGSPAYMAPELISGRAYLGPPVDVWALGNFLFELLHGRVAFRGQSMAELNMRIRKANHQPFRQELGGKGRGAIKRALTVAVEERPSAAELTRQLVREYALKVPAADKYSM